MKGFVEMLASKLQRHVEHSEIETAELLPALSVVAPAYNEQESIEDFVVEMCQQRYALPPAANAAGASYELICVDDGSTDQTFARLVALQQRFPRLRPLALDRNHGQSAALAAGVAVARGEIIALIDADQQNDPADVGRLYEMLQSDGAVDALVGVRARRRDTWLRRI